MSDREQDSTCEELSFEKALADLESVVRQLEDGQIGLAEALARYESGVGLLKHCHRLLEQAQRRIEILSGVDAEGNPITTPLDDSELSLDEKAEKRSQRRSKPKRASAAEPQPGEEPPMDELRSLF